MTKDFYLGENCKENLKLLGKIMQKIFKFEDLVCNEEMFESFTKLVKKKKDSVNKFY